MLCNANVSMREIHLPNSIGDSVPQCIEWRSCRISFDLRKTCFRVTRYIHRGSRYQTRSIRAIDFVSATPNRTRFPDFLVGENKCYLVAIMASPRYREYRSQFSHLHKFLILFALHDLDLGLPDFRESLGILRLVPCPVIEVFCPGKSEFQQNHNFHVSNWYL